MNGASGCTLRPKIAVVGAGISGTIFHHLLSDRGMDVTVFEKSRGLGGRMATRRDGGLRYDHGAQYFTVRDERFENYSESWLKVGVVELWQARICTLAGGTMEWRTDTNKRYVAVPGMSAIARHLALGLNVCTSTRVVAPTRVAGQWQVFDDEDNELGGFDAFICSAPAPQSLALLSGAPSLQNAISNTQLDACWAVMLSFPKSLEIPFDGAFVKGSALSWVACNSSKPGRNNHPDESWVLHASPEWSNEHLDADPDGVLAELTSEFWRVAGIQPSKPNRLASHLWRYAIPPAPLESRCLFDDRQLVGVCGDWCGGPRVEGAFLSGMNIADRVTQAFADAATQD